MAQDRKTSTLSVHDARSKAAEMLRVEQAKPNKDRMLLWEAYLELCIKVGDEPR